MSKDHEFIEAQEILVERKNGKQFWICPRCGNELYYMRNLYGRCPYCACWIRKPKLNRKENKE